MGFDVGAYGIKPSLSEIRAIAEWPTPVRVRDVRSFVGLANFYRKFVHWFSEIASPLTDLTKKIASLNGAQRRRKPLRG